MGLHEATSKVTSQMTLSQRADELEEQMMHDLSGS